MTWLGHNGRVELSNKRSNPIRQDRFNEDGVSEWRPATLRQPHEDYIIRSGSDLSGSRDPTHPFGSGDPTEQAHSLVGTRTTESYI